LRDLKRGGSVGFGLSVGGGPVRVSTNVRGSDLAGCGSLLLFFGAIGGGIAFFTGLYAFARDVVTDPENWLLLIPMIYGLLVFALLAVAKSPWVGVLIFAVVEALGMFLAQQWEWSLQVRFAIEAIVLFVLPTVFFIVLFKTNRSSEKQPSFEEHPLFKKHIHRVKAENITSISDLILLERFEEKMKIEGIKTVRELRDILASEKRDHTKARRALEQQRNFLRKKQPPENYS
jgi:hypothetical protein